MDADQEIREHQREYLDFLDDEADRSVYVNKIKEMIHTQSRRLIVNINDLRRKFPERAANLLKEAQLEILSFQRAIREYVLTVDDAYGKQFEEFFVGFEGSFGAMHVTPRSLSARHISNLVCVEGIITKCSQVRPKVVKSVHYCPATKKTIERKYSDLSSLDPFPSSSVYPTRDEDGNLLETEYGLSLYRDHQTQSIQEMPEQTPAGQLPRSVDIILNDDLVDLCKPGDRVQVVGNYRCMPFKHGGYTNGTFRTVLLATHILALFQEVAPLFSANDVAKIKRFSRSKQFDPFEMLANSLAPSIHGHEQIKKAVLCMLLGGVEKILENGTRLRGDINLLLIGDPSTAKSQMLRYVLHTAPRAVTTTGRGSSGVGLTAAVTTDNETGERRLEAGAMVLADRGVVCIDEFDKMSDMDRTAIHEVMEQGQVTIAKAGIHVKLNARCSVLAAANPVWGRYDEYKSPMDNIGMQDSLLSRFDIIFVVLDNMDPDHDRRISDHVLRMHRYRNPGEQDGEPLAMGEGGHVLAMGDTHGSREQEDGEVSIFEKHNHLLHGKVVTQKMVSASFMRKYIHVARALKPVLTSEACDVICTEYAKLRSQEMAGSGKAKTQPVTARTLETLIRLSTAHAKARMSKRVELVDAELAIELINFAYFKKVGVRLRKKKAKEGEEEEDKEGTKTSKRKTSRKGPTTGLKRPKLSQGDAGYDPYYFTSSEEEDGTTPTKRHHSAQGSHDKEETMDTKTALATESIVMDTDRLRKFRSCVAEAFLSKHSQSLPISELTSQVNSDPSTQFSDAEVSVALERMQEANQVMLSEGMVFLI